MKGNDMERVENTAATGTPDVDGCLQGNTYKIELKREPARQNGNVKVRFRPMQIPWMQRRWKAGGNVWVLLAVGEGHKVKRFLIRGCDAAILEDTTEEILEEISVITTNATPKEVIITASGHAFV